MSKDQANTAPSGQWTGLTTGEAEADDVRKDLRELVKKRAAPKAEPPGFSRGARVRRVNNETR